MKRMSVAVLALFAVASGCVSQADYDQLMVANRSLTAAKEAAEQRALDAEELADATRNQLRLKESELDVQKQLASNLRQENERLAEMVNNAENLINKFDFKPDKPIVVNTVLPAEMDQALRSFAASHPDAVEYDPSRGVVKWKSDLLFASGSDVVREDAKSTLRSFAEIVNTVEGQGYDIVVAGHTDSDPIKHSAAKHPTNWHLSAHRSIAVVRELRDANISPQRLAVMGYGEYRPVAANESAETKALNRRVEIFIVGTGGVPAEGGVAASQQETRPTAPQK